VAGYNSPKNKIAFTLTCMKGNEVSGWTQAMREMLDTLPQDQNVPLLWDFFLQEFNIQYLDTAREDQARAEITKLKLKDNNIDAYIAKFKELARQAGYTLGSPESVQLFKEGLSYPILADVMRAPTVSGYYTIKERAIHSTMAQRKLAAKRTPGQNTPFIPFLNRRPNYNPHSNPPNQQCQYNSSNAPQTMNNVPVPMDVGRVQSQNNWRAQGRGNSRGQ
jgi:hypothetical protein